jgi:hypothetical protein
MSYGRKEKETWVANLPPFRHDAVGRLCHGTVFALFILHKDPSRYIRLELSTDYARALAADLVRAAERAEKPRQVA